MLYPVYVLDLWRLSVLDGFLLDIYLKLDLGDFCIASKIPELFCSTPLCWCTWYEIELVQVTLQIDTYKWDLGSTTFGLEYDFSTFTWERFRAHVAPWH